MPYYEQWCATTKTLSRSDPAWRENRRSFAAFVAPLKPRNMFTAELEKAHGEWLTMKLTGDDDATR